MLYEARCPGERKTTIWQSIMQGMGVTSRCLTCAMVVPVPTSSSGITEGNATKTPEVPKEAPKALYTSYVWDLNTKVVRDAKGRWASIKATGTF